jgi:hypothetical protein
MKGHESEGGLMEYDWAVLRGGCWNMIGQHSGEDANQ